MAALPAIHYRKVVKAFEAMGWQKVRQKGQPHHHGQGRKRSVIVDPSAHNCRERHSASLDSQRRNNCRGVQKESVTVE